MTRAQGGSEDVFNWVKEIDPRRFRIGKAERVKVKIPSDIMASARDEGEMELKLLCLLRSEAAMLEQLKHQVGQDARDKVSSVASEIAQAAEDCREAVAIGRNLDPASLPIPEIHNV
ncbi:hypothetical protein HK102_008418 [Quaeritorhiza haematococci]|nr:hypothetical protein HK102_008418 [Quaeritorhiza haematococci]